MNSKDCIFCKIANGEIKTELVWDADEIVAFKDINPQAPTHILVIPKKHYPTLSDIDDETILQKLMVAVQKITNKYDIKEYRTVINTGKQAGQEVFHVHLHILSGRQMLWPAG